MTKLAGLTSTVYDATLALLYPQACAVCGGSVERSADGVACADCWDKSRLFSPADVICWKCGTPSVGKIAEEKKAEVRCRRCDAESFTAARAVGAYRGALRASVLALKREPFVAPRLARLLQDTQQRAPLNNATRVVPVPLHPKRFGERGFNQASELGRAVATRARLPFDEWSVVRTVHTERHRSLMDEHGRRESVQGAFCVARPRLVEGESILLVDDVFTTGATVSACASALLSAGARSVYVLTVARPT